MLVLSDVILVIFAALLIFAAIQDVREYRIPNEVIIALIAIYPVFYLTSSAEISLLWSVSISAVFFLIGLGLFSAGLMGGGDVKLIAVTGLWVGADMLIPFLFVMSMVGAAMSVFMLLLPLRLSVASLCMQMGLNGMQEKILADQVPYGVAIAAGGVFAACRMVGGF